MWTNPLYSRDPVDQRHGRYQPRFRTVEPRHGVVPSVTHLEGLDLSMPCWTGECPKCGRTLISATTHVWVRRDRYECGIC
jgi:hypothetical protein